MLRDKFAIESGLNYQNGRTYTHHKNCNNLRAFDTLESNRWVQGDKAVGLGCGAGERAKFWAFFIRCFHPAQTANLRSVEADRKLWLVPFA